jgi:hypothetical protein
MLKKQGNAWVDSNGTYLCCPLGNENCSPFIAMGNPWLPGATMDDCALICEMHAQEIADLHARMRATFASLYPQQEVPDAVR